MSCGFAIISTRVELAFSSSKGECPLGNFAEAFLSSIQQSFLECSNKIRQLLPKNSVLIKTFYRQILKRGKKLNTLLQGIMHF